LAIVRVLLGVFGQMTIGLVAAYDVTMATGYRPLTDRIRQVLAQRGIEHSRRGDDIRVDYGSAEVVLSVNEDRSAISLRAIVVGDISIEDQEDEIRLLRSLNDRNSRLEYGRFFYDPARREIVHDCQILATHLQASELMNGLVSVARTADEHDDLLCQELGAGVRAADLAGRPEAPLPF